MPSLQIDKKSALDRLLRLLKVPGVSLHEAAVSQTVEKMLLGLGVRKAWIKRDHAHRHFDGRTGNLIARLPGSGQLRRAGRRFFSAHLDTVPVCAGAQALLQGSYIRPKGKTGLGADDRAGVAAVISGLAEAKARTNNIPPLTLAFTVSEELGLFGAQYMDRKVLADCAMGFNVDGGSPAHATVGAPSGFLLDIEITGIPSHAGGAPQRGASAATVFALATTELAKGGWLGKIVKGRQEGRMNFGMVQGGNATNVVMPSMTINGEARAHSEALLNRIITTAEKAFHRAARKVKNDQTRTAKVRFKATRNYTRFKLPLRSAVMKEYQRACKKTGAAKLTESIGFGAVDANYFCAKGLPTVTFGAGGRDAHCVGERCYLPDYYLSVAVLTELMTGT
jgi:tripeptide aminopeptidase